MHGVVVIPFAAPDEAVPFERLDYLSRDTVPEDLLTSDPQVPFPVISIRDVDVDRDSEGVRTQLVAAFDCPPVVRAPDMGDVFS